MVGDRHLDWDGCFNVRDLGGLRTMSGLAIRRGALIRADAVDRLTADGWSALHVHGVRTVVDLRNDDEIGSDTAPRPADVTTVHLPLDGVHDTEFWARWGDGRHGTPLYYRPFLDRFPDRVAGVVAAVAHAGPGGVLVHCGVGRDRTGLVTMLLLVLAGVAAEDIAADYDLSASRLPPLFAARGTSDQQPRLQALLDRERTSAAAVIVSTLAELDVERRLRTAGLTAPDLDLLRRRLTGGEHG